MLLIVLLALGLHYEKGICQVGPEHSQTWIFPEPCITGEESSCLPLVAEVTVQASVLLSPAYPGDPQA